MKNILIYILYLILFTVSNRSISQVIYPSVNYAKGDTSCITSFDSLSLNNIIHDSISSFMKDSSYSSIKAYERMSDFFNQQFSTNEFSKSKNYIAYNLRINDSNGITRKVSLYFFKFSSCLESQSLYNQIMRNNNFNTLHVESPLFFQFYLRSNTIFLATTNSEDIFNNSSSTFYKIINLVINQDE